MSPDRSVYMDYNATSPARRKALEVFGRVATECAGNASSTHGPGRRAKAVLDDARETLAAAVNARAPEVVFTSGGTEGDNTAVKGVALARGGGHVVTTEVEHPAVLESCRWLEARGFEVTYLGVDGDGRVDPRDVGRAVRPDTALITVMWVNNETGVIQPVDEIGAVARQRGIPYHSDAVQAFGRVPIDLETTPVDLLTISGHKFGAPSGTGALVVRRGIEFVPLVSGGGQERNRRSGTYNVPGAAAMATAAQLAVDELDTEPERQTRLRDRLEAGTMERVPDARVNGAGAPRVGNTTNVRFDGADGEAVLVALDGRGVAASSASACAASRNDPSYVLMAMGLSRRQAEDSMRFSLGRHSTEDDVDTVLDLLPGVIEGVRSARRL
jgi:cysteine desulfurase